MNKLISKFDFKSSIFRFLRLLDPSECQDLTLATFEQIHERFAIDFDIETVKMEFREFAVDCDVTSGS